MVDTHKITTPNPTREFARLHFFSLPMSGSNVVQLAGETLSLVAPDCMPDRTQATRAAQAANQRIYSCKCLFSFCQSGTYSEQGVYC
jgi:hypothetical protein